MIYNIEMKTIDYKSPRDLSVTKQEVTSVEAYQLDDNIKNFSDKDIERHVESASRFLRTVLIARRAALNGHPTKGKRPEELPHGKPD